MRIWCTSIHSDEYNFMSWPGTSLDRIGEGQGADGVGRDGRRGEEGVYYREVLIRADSQK
jgi:hypothetical protein